MPILAIDTSSQWCSVAIYFADGTHISRHEKVGNKASQVLLTWIDELMQEAHITWKDLQALAVSQGPGAFTGIRLGLGVAQGLAYAQQKPLIPIPSLDGMVAYELFIKGNKIFSTQGIHAMLDARMQQVYFASYQMGEDKTIIRDNSVQLINLKDLNFNSQDIYFAYELEGYIQEGVIQAPKIYQVCAPHAIGIAYLAAFKLGSEQFLPMDCQPLYIRDQVALSISQRANQK
jgi:tRNA threonylcarbamoyladenosine biosynthesis protein TsaB